MALKIALYRYKDYDFLERTSNQDSAFGPLLHEKFCQGHFIPDPSGISQRDYSL